MEPQSATRATMMTQQFWNGIADDYDRVQVPVFRRFAEDALRLADIRAGQLVLDVATGPGTLALLAARAGAEVVAVDFAPAMIARLRDHAATEGLSNLTAEMMDGQALDLPDNTFDVACAMFGVSFYPDRAAGFRELHRVVRPGGTVAVSAWSTADENFPKVATAAIARALPHREPLAANSALADARTLERELRASGLRDVRIESSAHPSRAGLTCDGAWETSRRWWSLVDLDDAEREAVRPKFFALLRERYGDGPVLLTRRAHIGIGTK